jgi:predicted nucleotidyltransferase component of viral defense system
MAEERRVSAASVKQRLLDLARREGRVHEVVLVRYALERLLYRLSISPYRNEFILKGGMLVTQWLGSASRETRDADFLGRGDADMTRFRRIFEELTAIDADDALMFDSAAIRVEPIREDMEYEGIRIRCAALLERSRIPMIIDIGFGDAVVPAATAMDYPSLLGMETPNIQAYPPAAVIAEKFQAMVALGFINGRMKDYHDLWAIPQAMHIDADDLDNAIAATFARRRTALPADRPDGLTGAFASDADRQRQWNRYAASIGLDGVSLETVVEAAWKLVGPSCARILQSSRQ